MTVAKPRVIRVFEIIAAVCLLATASAKLFSSLGAAKVLALDDPIFAIPFRVVFVAASAIEGGIGIVCLLSKRVWLPVVLIAYISGLLILYRVGLLIVHYHSPCPCMGTLTDALHITPANADLAMKWLLAFLTIGSCGSLIWLKFFAAGPPKEP